MTKRPADNGESAIRSDLPEVATADPDPSLAASLRIGQPQEIRCVFAGLALQVRERSVEDYAAFLEDL